MRSANQSNASPLLIFMAAIHWDSTSNRCVLAVSFEIKLKLLDSSIHDLDGGCLAKGLYLRSLKRKAPADEDASEKPPAKKPKAAPKTKPKAKASK